MKKSHRIAIDMDEVIADAGTAMRLWLKSEFDLEWPDEALSGVKLKSLLNEDQFQGLQAHLHGGEFFGALPVMPGSQAALAELSKQHEVFITTAAMEYPKSLAFKWDWLQANFPFLDPLNFVFCGDKSIINADFLIDDNAHHFARFIGQGIIFDAPHNHHEVGYPRLIGWQDAASLIQGLTAA